MKRNLGSLERVIRPILGLLAIGASVTQPQFGLSEGIVLILGSFLVLNGITARCYLWQMLGINTARDNNCNLDESSSD